MFTSFSFHFWCLNIVLLRYFLDLEIILRLLLMSISVAKVLRVTNSLQSKLVVFAVRRIGLLLIFERYFTVYHFGSRSYSISVLRIFKIVTLSWLPDKEPRVRLIHLFPCTLLSTLHPRSVSIFSSLWNSSCSRADRMKVLASLTQSGEHVFVLAWSLNNSCRGVTIQRR